MTASIPPKTTAGPAPAATPFQTLFRHSADRANLCTVTLLAWLSACDGTVAPAEEAFLRRICAAGRGTSDHFEQILAVATAARVEDLEVACRYAMSHFSPEQKHLVAELAIGLTAEDGHVTVGENYALQFLADLLDVRPKAFAELFEEVTGRPYPKAGDPGTIAWWVLREAGIQAAPATDLPEDPAARQEPEVDAAPERPVDEGMTRALALALLGLAGTPSVDDVRTAYRRLAKVRHPDRFAKLGPSAIAAATESFKTLQEAYELLQA